MGNGGILSASRRMRTRCSPVNLLVFIPRLLRRLRSGLAYDGGKEAPGARFRILTDRTLTGIVQARPKDESELLDVSVIGPALLGKYGRALLSIVAEPR
jgi:hypothetical protein